jgi:hypothetical protein
MSGRISGRWLPGRDEPPGKGRLRLAWSIAIGADFLQIVAFPFLWVGAASPADDVLDVVTAGALTALLGWHWSFLPSFLVKLTPALDLVPTWSAALFLATRKSEHPGERQDSLPGEAWQHEAQSALRPAATQASLPAHQPGAEADR